MQNEIKTTVQTTEPAKVETNTTRAARSMKIKSSVKAGTIRGVAAPD